MGVGLLAVNIQFKRTFYQTPQLRADALCLNSNRGGHIQIAKHRHFPPAKNTGLLKGNLFARISQIFHMIHIHTGHHRAIMVEHIHRIQPPAEADFQYRHLDRLINETLHRSQRAEFKISQRYCNRFCRLPPPLQGEGWGGDGCVITRALSFACLLNFFKRGAQLRITRLTLGDAHALVVIQ